jgi:hypothetical protein
LTWFFMSWLKLFLNSSFLLTSAFRFSLPSLSVYLIVLEIISAVTFHALFTF